MRGEILTNGADHLTAYGDARQQHLTIELLALCIEGWEAVASAVISGSHLGVIRGCTSIRSQQLSLIVHVQSTELRAATGEAARLDTASEQRASSRNDYRNHSTLEWLNQVRRYILQCAR